MKDWWRGLQARERRMVSVAIVVVAAALVYALVWHPLRRAVVRTQGQVADMRAELAWMQRAAGKLEAGKHGDAHPAPRIDGSLLEVVDRLSRHQGLRSAITTLSQRGDHRVQVDMKTIGFDRFLRWLDALHAQRIHVASMTLTPSGPGQVVANLVLARADAGGGPG